MCLELEHLISLFLEDWESALGCHQSQADHSLFTLITHTSITLVLVYVDDILVAGNDISQIEIFKIVLSTHFKTKDLGSLKFVLGLEVARSPKFIFLNQSKYALDILSDGGQLGAWTTSFPMEQHLKLKNQDGGLLLDPCMYHCLVGRLIYLTITRPDIVYVVNILTKEEDSVEIFVQEFKDEEHVESLSKLKYEDLGHDKSKDSLAYTVININIEVDKRENVV
ncbi:uncharacterized mitochondrial protein AtMg00810-like [Carya illinoinensis]|uniref:uncharacterized mitochondrial protein AtMg00810-like n=1 Tax=Carya illinoinensis TaxID=32201 RepID=UPI001C71FFFF|nr:uncharacterized mitochondrial protein AtMg00810-like [Carya illinoinensis]